MLDDIAGSAADGFDRQLVLETDPWGVLGASRPGTPESRGEAPAMQNVSVARQAQHMPPRERAVDRGTRRARAIETDIGREIRLARRDGGLTQGQVGAACDLSGAYVSLIELGEAHGASVTTLCRVASVVGLDLTMRVYPGGTVLRDAGHAALLERLRVMISPTLSWRTEVPLPNPGDQRAWDAMISGPAFRIGVEGETRPRDGQALQRRLALKRRDGGVDHLLLVLSATKGNRMFLREAAGSLAIDFPVAGRMALEALAAGNDPGGSAIVLI